MMQSQFWVPSRFLVIILVMSFPFATDQRPCDTGDRVCKTGLCNIAECLQCDSRVAVCTTTNPSEVVPHELTSQTRYLFLTYNGPPVKLDMAIFQHLPYLKEIKIIGKNVTSLAPQTFSHQANLKKINITSSQISALPNILFSANNKIAEFYFPRNQFDKFPLNIFPNIRHARRMEFSYNPLMSCSVDKTTIGHEFKNLTSLERLQLKGFGLEAKDCQDLSVDYLSPLQHIQMIDFDESHIFSAGDRILASLDKLTELHISNAPLYRECPANARNLFNNLPKGLKMLSMKYWTTTSRANSSCFLDGESLAGLKTLKSLSKLDMRYSDKIFGNSLTKSVFDGFQDLTTLFIGWCGISWIEDNAFDSLNRMTNLILGGNLLGPRKFSMYEYSSNSKLKVLNLMSIGINAAERYDISGIIEQSPKLGTLYLDSNLLKELPIFLDPENNSTDYHQSAITHMKISNNYIGNFSVAATSQMCKALPKLVSFTAESNLLSDVTGLCLTIQTLYLANNLVGRNMEKNLKALSKLTSMQHLDLSNNLIGYIPSYLFEHMPHLSILMLSQNQIPTLPTDLSVTCPDIKTLHFTSNLLSSFTKHDIKGLNKLEEIYIEDNAITSLEKELLKSLSDDHPVLVRFAIDENPLTCSCDSYVKKWIVDSKITLQPKDIRCSPPELRNSSVKVRLIDYTPNTFYCFIELPMIIILTLIGGFLVSLAIALPCYKYRWYISHCRIVFRAIVEKLKEVRFEQQCEYDALVSYNSESESDREWVEQKLIHFVEEATPLAEDPTNKKPKLFITDRDSTPGASIYNELCETVKNSRKIIILLTNSYLSSTSCLHQAQFLASTNMLDNSECYQPDRILVIILEELNEDIIVAPITALLTSNANVMDITECQNDDTKMRRVWRKVKNFISKPKYVYRKGQNKRKRADRQSNGALESNPSDETTPLLA